MIFFLYDKREPKSTLLQGQWIPIQRKTRYLKIQAELPTMVHEPMPFRNRLQFWDNIFKPIVKKDEL